MIESVNLDNQELLESLQNKFSVIYSQKNELKNEFINNPYTKIYIYKEFDDVLGLIHINDIYDRFEINNLYVIDSYRNRGIASKLMNKVINIGREKGIINITLEVRKDNIAAINLYKKFGFVEKVIRIGYYNGQDAILMQKDL